jgi:hypothetical protein
MSVDVYNELMAYVEHYDTEVSGCGMVETREYKNGEQNYVEYKITEIFLPEKQSNSSASTDIDDSMIHELMTQCIKENKDISKMKLHWHSHANMGTFHSGTDEDNYKTLNNGEFLVSLVINKDKEVLGRIDYYKPFIASISGVPVYIVVDSNENTKAKDNIEKLDKYIAEHKTISVYTQLDYDSNKEFGYVSYTPWDIEQERIRNNVCSQLRINKKLRKKLDECVEEQQMGDVNGKCFQCKDEAICTQYSILVEQFGGV